MALVHTGQIHLLQALAGQYQDQVVDLRKSSLQMEDVRIVVITKEHQRVEPIVCQRLVSLIVK